MIYRLPLLTKNQDVAFPVSVKADATNVGHGSRPRRHQKCSRIRQDSQPRATGRGDPVETEGDRPAAGGRGRNDRCRQFDDPATRAFFANLLPGGGNPPPGGAIARCFYGERFRPFSATVQVQRGLFLYALSGFSSYQLPVRPTP